MSIVEKYPVGLEVELDEKFAEGMDEGEGKTKAEVTGHYADDLAFPVLANITFPNGRVMNSFPISIKEMENALPVEADSNLNDWSLGAVFALRLALADPATLIAPEAEAAFKEIIKSFPEELYADVPAGLDSIKVFVEAIEAMSKFM